MRILFTTFSYYPERSGIPVVVQYLAEGLASRGYDVSVVTCLNKNKEVKEVINGVNVYRFDVRLSSLRKPIGEVQEYIDFVISFPKDVLWMECLQCHMTDPLLPHLYKMNCKILLHAHGAPGLTLKPLSWQGDLKHTISNPYHWYRWKKYYCSFFPKYAKYIDASISSCICASDIAYFSKHIKKNLILENSCNDFFFDGDNYNEPIKDILGITNSKYIVNIATLNNRKNQLLLIDAFVKANLEGTSLVIIGTTRNNYYYKLVKKAEEAQKRYGKEVVILDSSVQRKYFPSIIHHALLFALTSRWEEYSISLVETMAVGTPFVSTMAGNAHTLPGGLVARTEEELPVLFRVLLSNDRYLIKLGSMAKKYAYENNRLSKIIDGAECIITDLFR
jgi:glycosyltransferase involved in cell wall biosynthesis